MPGAERNIKPADYESLYRSYLDLRREVDHLSTLREIGLAITSTLEIEETLEIIANVVQGALDVQRLAIFEVDRDVGIARPVIAKYGDDVIRPDRLEGETVPLRGTSLGEAVASRQVVFVNTSFESEAYVPLMAKNTPLGVMRIENRRDGLPLSEDDEPLFQSVGSQIAVAINNAQLYALAVTDGLTGLYVRRYFDLRMDEEFDQAKRYKRLFSLMLFDIDHFKKFNDMHGHQTGDMVLRQFADLIKENTRRSDVCCRYGGEEMAVILPETDLEKAAVLASKLCERIRSHPFQGASNKKLSVTTSIGVAAFSDEFPGPDDMVKEVDKALYKAKELGRNRVELAGL